MQKDNIHRYRKIKQIVTAAADHEQELKLFAFETRSEMHLTGTPLLHKWWIGCYWACSDFGQSLIRPLVGWACYFYLCISPTHRCCILIEILPTNTTKSHTKHTTCNAAMHLWLTVFVTVLFILIDINQAKYINACLYDNARSIPLLMRCFKWYNSSFQRLWRFCLLWGCATALRSNSTSKQQTLACLYNGAPCTHGKK